MNRSDLTAAALLVVLAAGSTLAAAQDRDRTQAQDKDQTKDRDQIRDRDIYGSQLMTNEERNQYRTRMRSAKTDQERERIRAEHHERMKVRAKERGVTLPDTPPARGGGMGPGGGMGKGGGR
jgi:arginine/ornithine N-succinyltransferase beta subunit